jgi:ProP effector
MSNNINEIITLLAEKFPRTFMLYEQRRVPLKTGIRSEVLAALPDLEPRAIRTALALHAQAPGYLRAVVRGGPRIGLDGLPAGAVTAAEAAWALEQAIAGEQRRRARRADQARARAEEGAASRASSPSAVPRASGTSLADLRRAAGERRERAQAGASASSSA